MRLVGTLDTLEQANLFSANLRKKKIEHSLEERAIWVHSEDQLDEALKLFTRFARNPGDPEFAPIGGELKTSEKSFEQTLRPLVDEPEAQRRAEIEEVLEPRRGYPFTSFLIAFCAVLFFLNAFQQIALLEKGAPIHAALSTPIQTALFFDVPPEIEKLGKMVALYQPAIVEKQIPPLPIAIQEQIATANQTPFWRGLFELALLKIKGEELSIAKGPLCTKIAQGEFWRLLTPIFLHGSLLHLLFNMMWLWLLGRQIEQRLGIFRYLLLTVAIGVFANALQYIMSGPFFLGYSGVALGLAGFIWSRERAAPWEGYPLQKQMFLFLGLFVLAMCLLQGASLALLLLSLPSFDPNIANTAHLAGAACGAILGRSSFFSARNLKV